VVWTRPSANNSFEVGQLLLTAFVYSDTEWGHGFAIDKCEKQLWNATGGVKGSPAKVEASGHAIILLSVAFVYTTIGADTF
jgi:hypothetical protein